MNPGKPKHPLLYFIGAGVQMCIVLCAGIFLGRYLDHIYPQKNPKLFTIIGVCIALVLALYVFIKKALDLSKEDEPKHDS